MTNDEIIILKQKIDEQKLEIEDLKKRLLNLENQKKEIMGENQVNNKLDNYIIVKESKRVSNSSQIQTIEKLF